MKLNIIEKLIGSVFFTGYIKFAPGTFGSLAAILIYFIPGFENPTVMISAITVCIILGIRLGNKFEKYFGKDPSQFTLDEVVGTWISLLLVPKTILFVSLAFLVWRGLDIIKPFPAGLVEKIKGGTGIVLDDIIAGFYSLIIIHIIVYFVK